MKQSAKTVRIPMGYPSMRRLMWDAIGTMLSPLAIASLILLLSRFVSVPEWIEIWIWAIPAAGLLIGWFLPLACFVHLTEESVRLTCLGIAICTIPWTDVRLICGVGTESDQCLCLSRLGAEETATLREEKLRKSVITKDEAVFLKRAPDWQNRFVRDYLNNCRSRPYAYLRDKNRIWIAYDPNTLLACRALCPHGAYRNLLVRSPIPAAGEQPDLVVTLQLQKYEYRFRFADDGVHVIHGKQEDWVMKADEIRTVACVHRFTADSKYTRNHTVCLVAATLTVGQLAAAERAHLRGGRRDLMALLHDREELLAATRCLRETARWRRTHRDFCPVYDTPKNRAALRDLCPNARWIDPYSEILD